MAQMMHVQHRQALKCRVRCRYYAINFLTNISQKTPPVYVIIYVISYKTGPRYNDTRLFIDYKSIVFGPTSYVNVLRYREVCCA